MPSQSYSTVEVTDEMREFALLMEKSSAQKSGERVVYNKYGEKVRHTYTGTLGELGVSAYIQNLGLEFVAYTDQIYKHGGDTVDIQYEDDRIDVKTNQCSVEQKLKYHNFLVFTDQLPKTFQNKITHFIFTTVDTDYRNVRIWGAISVHAFVKYAVDKKLDKMNKEIDLRYLQPITSYLYRAPFEVPKFRTYSAFAPKRFNDRY